MYPRRPTIDPDSLCVVHEAIEILALLRGLCCPISDPHDPEDPADVLHLAWSLSLQIDASLPDMIAAAHEHGYSWDQIRDFLNPATP